MPELHFPPRTGLLAGSVYGADGGNRTLILSLEGFCITTMLRPRSRPRPISYPAHGRAKRKMEDPLGFEPRTY